MTLVRPQVRIGPNPFGALAAPTPAHLGKRPGGLVKLDRRSALAATLAALVVACDRGPQPGSSAGSAPESKIGPLMAPAELAKRLDDVKAGRIVVLYVGPDVLFDQARVPGAKRLPETGTEEGYAALVRAIEQTPKDTEIVVYCGCCPYRNCQNVKPASKAIRASGRSNVKYLDLPTNFKTDWTKLGYPVERG